jgi:hypothetical protein
MRVLIARVYHRVDLLTPGVEKCKCSTPFAASDGRLLPAANHMPPNDDHAARRRGDNVLRAEDFAPPRLARDFRIAVTAEIALVDRYR